jgi:hypothetical protein
MIRARSLVWLVALIAFLVPTLAMASMAHANAPVEGTALADCPEHAPPPDPCPAKDTAKHAAGDCCPLMTSVLALLPSVAGDDLTMSVHSRVAECVHSFAGRLFTKDPPPPRV